MSGEANPPGADVYVRLFGRRVVLEVNGVQTKLRSTRSRLLLARLALAEPGAELRTPIVARELWPDRSDKQDNIRRAKSELAEVLGPLVLGVEKDDDRKRGPDNEGMVGLAADVRSDFREFEQELNSGNVGGAQVIAARGEFLARLEGRWFDERRRTFKEQLERLGEPGRQSNGLSRREALPRDPSSQPPRSGTESAGSATNADHDASPGQDQPAEPQSGANQSSGMGGSAGPTDPDHLAAERRDDLQRERLCSDAQADQPGRDLPQLARSPSEATSPMDADRQLNVASEPNASSNPARPAGRPRGSGKRRPPSNPRRKAMLAASHPPGSDAEPGPATNANQDSPSAAAQAAAPQSTNGDRTTEMGGSPVANVQPSPATREPPSPATQLARGAWVKIAAVPLVLLVAAGFRAALLADHSDDSRPRTPPPPRSALPDASKALPDVKRNGEPVVLDSKAAGLCQNRLPGASAPRVTEIIAGGQVLAEVRTYYQAEDEKTCAKLVKIDGTPLYDRPTHLALTLCGDRNRCERDWHAYKIDAGPLVVPSRNGCVSWRVSMANRRGAWLVRDEVGRTGCS